MLTSFFGTTKPSTVVIVISFMTLAVVLSVFQASETILEWTEIGKNFGMMVIYWLTMFVLNFVAQKNDLTKRNAYKILLFAGFTTAIPAVFNEPKIILSGLFVMLALRRIISLRSGIGLERKIFDASFWLTIASLFYFWSVAFFVLLFMGILVFATRHVRYWFIPFVGILCVALLTSCYVLFLGENQSFVLDYLDGVSFDFSAYSQWSVLIAITFFIGIFLWSVFSYTGEMRKAAIAQRPIYILVMMSAFIAALIAVITPNKTGAEWYFFVPSLCIIVTNYLELASGKFFKEILLWLIVLLPLSIFFMR